MIQIEKRELLFDGNEKQIFATDQPDKVIIHYKDVTTAYGGIKRARFKGIGCLNNKISAILFTKLEKAGLETHFIGQVGEREQLCRRIAWVDLVAVCHNRVVGSLAHRLGVEEGYTPANTIVDLRYNTDELGNPLINDDQAVAIGLVSYDELKYIYATVHKANEVLTELFRKAGISLVDFKMEFGRVPEDGHLIISDELSPDRCRLWDLETGEQYDKDRFRHDLGDIYQGYEIVLNRLEGIKD